MRSWLERRQKTVVGLAAVPQAVLWFPGLIRLLAIALPLDLEHERSLDQSVSVVASS